MPVITEETEANVLAFANDIEPSDLPERALTGVNDVNEEGRPYLAICPLHLDSTDCTCPGFLGDWDMPETEFDAGIDLGEPDYSKFENWIPRYIRPDKPCDYCRSRRLNCYLQRGEPHCTPCASLFRECSLTKLKTVEATSSAERPAGTFIDTLHVVDEDVAKEHGTFTGIKPLRSKIGNSGATTPVRGGDDAPGSTKRNGIRFPRHAVKTLRDWLDSHVDHPYPTEDEKAQLEKLTELKPSQIANWLANARRRKKVSERTRPRLPASPSLRPFTPAIDIPRSREKAWEELNPLERWKNSPPEHDPASITDIANAVANSELPDDAVSSSPSSVGRRGKGSSNGSAFSAFRAPSTTSQETGQTSSLSASSAAFSRNSSASHGSFGSFDSSLAGKRDRRRRRRPAQPPAMRKSFDDKKRIFQCTFCTDTFKSKYDWTRHEKSLHLSLEKWICAPLGPVVTDSQNDQTKCVYCDLHNPSSDHTESHNHRTCENKGLESRTFFRKDHLRQHLRLMHGCEMSKSMDNWKSTAVNINSRCGFCAHRFTIWQDRTDHLTAHFKAGARMSEWKGCRGLDPAVAAQVTNAMPPYLIGIESRSPNPFSATNRATWRDSCPVILGDETTTNQECAQEGTANADTSAYAVSGGKTTCWEILTLRLGRYTRQMVQEGIVITDEMLQAQARRILYDSDDPWEQTAADNPEWLDLFKKAHGLDYIPTAIGGQGLRVPEDIETYTDLGLRVPFAVQLEAINQGTQDDQAAATSSTWSSYEHTIDQRRKELQEMYSELAQDGVLYSADQKCQHAECTANFIDFSSTDGATARGYSPKRWCSREVSPSRATKMTEIVAKAGTVVHSLEAAVAAQQKESIDRGIQALWDLHEDSTTSGVASAEKQQHLKQAEYEASNARARSLAALARAEAPLPPYNAESPQLSAPTYMRRYRYELPVDRMKQFATITNAWQESGAIPEAFNTSTLGVSPLAITTTASTDRAASTTDAETGMLTSNTSVTTTDPFTSMSDDAFAANEPEWHLPDAESESGRALMAELDELILATTMEPESQNVPAVAPSMADQQQQQQQQYQHQQYQDNPVQDMTKTTGIDTNWNADLTDIHMEDFIFDDIPFEGMFDMPLDE